MQLPDHAEQVDDQKLREIFDTDAERYDRARPSYPEALFVDLTELTGLDAASTVIEIGPGTGQATRSLVATGACVTAVELGPQLAAVLRSRLPEVEVVNAAFEDWGPSAPVDLVTSFTAWHWVDPSVRAQRVHDALRPGGRLATVTTAHVRGGTIGFFDEAQKSYLRWDPATDAGERLLPAEEVAPVIDEIDFSPLFGPATRRRHLSDVTYTTDSYLDVLQTYSGHRALPDAARTGLLNELRSLIDVQHGGTITKTYLYELRVAQAYHP